MKKNYEGWVLFGAICALVLMFAILPIPMMLAWKGIAVSMFGLPMIGYWPAFWTNLTIAIWFGGVGYHPNKE